VLGVACIAFHGTDANQLVAGQPVEGGVQPRPVADVDHDADAAFLHQLWHLIGVHRLLGQQDQNRDRDGRQVPKGCQSTDHTSPVRIRRRRLDLIGLLVLCEITATITLSLATQRPRVAALREVAYFVIAGVFCLVTLLYRAPLTHASAMSIATFGDPKREQAFARAWREVPDYHRWQRLLTASLDLIIVAASLIKAYLLLSAPDDNIAHAVDASNIVTFVMLGALVAVSAVLIQRPRKIIERLLEQT
jgi:uncharacterized membrane protein